MLLIFKYTFDIYSSVALEHLLMTMILIRHVFHRWWAFSTHKSFSFCVPFMNLVVSIIISCSLINTQIIELQEWWHLWLSVLLISLFLCFIVVSNGPLYLLAAYAHAHTHTHRLSFGLSDTLWRSVPLAVWHTQTITTFTQLVLSKVFETLDERTNCGTEERAEVSESA